MFYSYSALKYVPRVNVSKIRKPPNIKDKIILNCKSKKIIQLKTS